MVKKNQGLWYPKIPTYRSYVQCLQDLNSDEVFEGLLGHGLFSENMPPIFTSEYFYDYVKRSNPNFSQKTCSDFIRYESRRNTNSIRLIGIPTPFSYLNLCKHIKDNWSNLLTHFENMTKNQSHKISRIHVRKQSNSKAIFKMSYQKWWEDETPETDLCIGARFLVNADISTCFPSIYTHSIVWALLSKKKAKLNKNAKNWENSLDYFTRCTTNNETHGILIGPHASNLISEIILTAIDKKLYEEKFSFTRHIDDYSCFVQSYEAGEKFLRVLRKELKEYGLSVNEKKINITALPICNEENWTNRLNYEKPIANSTTGLINYKQLQYYLDLATTLTEKNGDNLAVQKYAMKVIAKLPLNSSAKILAQKRFLHLSVIYPYLIPVLDDQIFTALQVDSSIIEEWCNEFYLYFYEQSYYEATAFLYYFAIKYGFSIGEANEQHVLESPDCLVKTLGAIYFKKIRSTKYSSIYNEAKRLFKDPDKDQYWLFWYVILEEKDLSGDWKLLKQQGVSFTK